MIGVVRTIDNSAAYLHLLLTRRDGEERGYELSRRTGSKKVVLLVPGFLGTRGALDILSRRFTHLGIPTFSLDPGLATILPQASVRASLETKIREMRKALDRIEQFDIVGHSLGGLLAYDVIETGLLDGLDARLVTLGTPFRGTWAGLLGGGLLPGANELLPIMSRYRDFGSTPRKSTVPLLSIAGEFDILAPPQRCRHPEAAFELLPVDHAGLVIRKNVFERVISFLTAA